MKKYVFRKYNPEYRTFFKLEKERLRKVLPASAKIEHVGSTAISDLGGKGILDILIGVSKNKIQGTEIKLRKTGYEFREKAGAPERLFFEKDYGYKNGKRRVHIHLVRINSKNLKEVLLFRDYLKTHPEAVKEYIIIKKEAVKKARGNGEIYRKHKEKFIKNILEKAKKK